MLAPTVVIPIELVAQHVPTPAQADYGPHHVLSRDIDRR